jgi:hypothetical protein
MGRQWQNRITPFSVLQEIARGRKCREWFGTLPDLNTQDSAANRVAFKNDPSLGATDDERRAAIDFCRWHAASTPVP